MKFMGKQLDRVPSVLACDVGNTHVRIAHVAGDTVSDLQRFPVGELAQIGPAIKPLWESMPAPRRIVAGSVNPAALKALEAVTVEVLGKEGQILVIGRDLASPIDTALDDPESIGVDRLCCASAAYDRLGTACVVADFGSAITVDCISDNGVFLGGAILPGLSMGSRALNNQTAQLPLVSLAEPAGAIGTSTVEAIRSGLVHGARGALRQLAEAYATQMGSWPTIIATGGDAPLVCPDLGESDLVQAIVPDLALRGVAGAYYRMLVKNATSDED